LFTGIIKELGTVEKLHIDSGGGTITVISDIVNEEAEIGDSIALNGVCLTVVNIGEASLGFDISSETLKVTNLGRLKSGDKLNLEPSLRATDFIGGHFVSGHIEAIGEIVAKKRAGTAWLYKITAPSELLDTTIDRGSICVDGISLTVTKVLASAFEVVIIPHTAKKTTLGYKKIKDTVNLESDLIGRYIKRIMETSLLSKNKKSDLSNLVKFGFNKEI